MPYLVNFTDSNNKTPITVFDNTASSDTSLKFPGRNVTGYGQLIAENFLALLENFASESEPLNPIEGQIWYNNNSGTLLLWDNISWKSASGIQKGPVEPSMPSSKVGELWVDTTNQQLRIFTGTRWVLVGPTESSVDGLRYGPVVEKIADSDNIDRFILTFYIADMPIIVFSKDSFTPKVVIANFNLIKSGINIANPTSNVEIDKFIGGNLPNLIGTASTANALNILGESLPVAASKFLRSDAINTTEFGINIRNNTGLTVGIDGTFNISNTSTSAKIYNSATGSSLDLQTNRNGIPATILRIINNKVGVNTLTPNEALDVSGNIALTGSILVNNNEVSTNLNNGSIRTLGGMAIAKNLIVGGGVEVTGVILSNNVEPALTDLYNSGSESRRWNTVRAKTIIADSIQGILDGSISGNANTATSLKNVTSFSLAGDVISTAIQFDGQTGSYNKIFNTTLTANIIADKNEPFPNISRKNDFILTYRASESNSQSLGLLKQTRDTFVGDLGIPIGTILPYAGTSIPYGFLLCDGAEVERVKYSNLFDIISTTYNGATVLSGVNTFRLPDLRGRFPLGRDNMDNGGTVPILAGGFVDAGGGTANRVPDSKAQILGGDAGQSSVTLNLTNLPDHSHTLNSGRQSYSAISVTTTIDPAATTGLGPTAPGQAQYLNDSGSVKKPANTTLGTAIGTMNPYLTLNYIIRSGPPAF
jgi:microcystin-dependent protein